MYDVIVIGLGAHGSAALYQLARRGLKVLGIDAWQPPHGRASHGGRSRIIRETYFEHPSYVPLVQRAFTLWEELKQASGRQILWRTGGLMLGPERGLLIQGTLASVRKHGLDCELLSPAEIRSRWPVFEAQSGMAGVYNKRDGVLLTDTAISAQLELAEAAGAELLLDAAVQSWSLDRGVCEVELSSGRARSAGKLLFCAGPGMQDLFSGLLPLTVTRQTQFWIEPLQQRGLFDADSCPVFICQEDGASERFFYGLPSLGSGVKVARHGLGTPSPASGELAPVTDADWEPLRQSLASMIPLLGAGRVVDTTLCRYTNTPDEHFIIDWHPQFSGKVLLCSACSGHGFKFAPAIGEACAQLLQEGRARADLSLFSLRRFGQS